MSGCAIIQTYTVQMQEHFPEVWNLLSHKSEFNNSIHVTAISCAWPCFACNRLLHLHFGEIRPKFQGNDVDNPTLPSVLDVIGSLSHDAEAIALFDALLFHGTGVYTNPFLADPKTMTIDKNRVVFKAGTNSQKPVVFVMPIPVPLICGSQETSLLDSPKKLTYNCTALKVASASCNTPTTPRYETSSLSAGINIQYPDSCSLEDTIPVYDGCYSQGNFSFTDYHWCNLSCMSRYGVLAPEDGEAPNNSFTTELPTLDSSMFSIALVAFTMGTFGDNPPDLPVSFNLHFAIMLGTYNHCKEPIVHIVITLTWFTVVFQSGITLFNNFISSLSSLYALANAPTTFCSFLHDCLTQHPSIVQFPVAAMVGACLAAQCSYGEVWFIHIPECAPTLAIPATRHFMLWHAATLNSTFSFSTTTIPSHLSPFSTTPTRRHAPKRLRQANIGPTQQKSKEQGGGQPKCLPTLPCLLVLPSPLGISSVEPRSTCSATAAAATKAQQEDNEEKPVESVKKTHASVVKKVKKDKRCILVALCDAEDKAASAAAKKLTLTAKILKNNGADVALPPRSAGTGVQLGSATPHIVSDRARHPQSDDDEDPKDSEGSDVDEELALIVDKGKESDKDSDADADAEDIANEDTANDDAADEDAKGEDMSVGDDGDGGELAAVDDDTVMDEDFMTTPRKATTSNASSVPEGSPSPPPSDHLEDLQGASRTTGGFARGNAFGTASNMADFVHDDDVPTIHTRSSGKVILYTTLARTDTPHSATTPWFPTLAPILKAVSRKYAIVAKSMISMWDVSSSLSKSEHH
ncbi:hypothetical protein BDN71DRAFT_1429659 [Pleurotus eryngii]|uniref:Uncharacterized protein n=1 Tax=Pleurotus eryngii TaxID=5323 RepID=A0A9P5ZZS9_PLEER|nr:hypothetical protein BDN71DRAFT_1429659 [Pleurotus eryngii]